ncbi:MAG: hypothetical protein IPL63_12540 [Saprospiraceae bacterium]|nr:hypothetical protein [Saprospiraceae bacterium]
MKNAMPGTTYFIQITGYFSLLGRKGSTKISQTNYQYSKSILYSCHQLESQCGLYYPSEYRCRIFRNQHKM